MKEETLIPFESGNYFVLNTGKSYSVNKNVLTHSISDSEYAHTEDGKSIAICRCKYLAKLESKKKEGK